MARPCRRRCNFFDLNISLIDPCILSPLLKVYGQMHRRIGSMLAPSNATQYSYLQVYFCDPADQDRYSASRNTSSKIDREKEKNVRVFADLRRILTQEVTTTYLQSFFNINEFIEQEQLNPEEVHLVLHSTAKPEQGIHLQGVITYQLHLRCQYFSQSMYQSTRSNPLYAPHAVVRVQII